VAALKDIGTPGALAALEAVLADPEREIRLATIRALTARAYRPALATVQMLVQTMHAREIDRTERMALFELYGTICGDPGVAVLEPLLNSRSGLFRRRLDPEVRACAAIALGRINTDPSRAALHRAVNERDVVVRSAISRALRGVAGRE
jgi:HEAT repeat protein